MAAAYVKGSRRVIGRNQNRIRGHLKHNIYPAFMGLHAEHRLVLECQRHNIEMSGGILYILGVRRNHKRDMMPNTHPCQYCWKLITEYANIRAIVYVSEGQIVKEFM